MKLFAPLLSSALLVGTAHAGAIDTATRNAVFKSNDALDDVDTQTNDTCITADDDSEVISEASYSGVAAPAPKEYDELGSDLGVEQSIDAIRAKECLATIESARKYVANEVMVDEKYAKTRDLCKNQHKDCTFWSVLGECENNPGYMHVNCAPVCQSCEMLHIETRCPLDPNAVDAMYPGDLSKMFERILSSPEYKQFEPVVVSRPPEGPWMMQFDNILSEAEAQRLIELGGEQGYERSSDVGKQKKDGTHENYVNGGRTSTNAWCVGDCYEDPIAQVVMGRIENITGIPETNSENLQLLRYEHDQFYQVHSDYIPYNLQRPCGVRILTFYMYLNEVEEGGGTNFPHVNNVTVTPKRGRAVLWPSVHDKDPNKKDSRTDHQALPVIKGVKYGANAWIHQRDFKGPNSRGCA
ncbi:unnamed protein product [Cylindrotheca closterium]|uniref:Procollagen-proline 4-dioxygenase n=1 Tax=Cylindrotheca closterium TaxID=2856 RepID=A0AAD2FNY4_9STRA|nr:unnamed protein product [Cylindrotheca closterium]